MNIVYLNLKNTKFYFFSLKLTITSITLNNLYPFPCDNIPISAPLSANSTHSKSCLWYFGKTRSIDTKKYEMLSVPLEEIGRMLGGWLGQAEKHLQQVQDKQNSPDKK